MSPQHKHLCSSTAATHGSSQLSLILTTFPNTFAFAPTTAGTGPDWQRSISPVSQGSPGLPECLFRAWSFAGSAHPWRLSPDLHQSPPGWPRGSALQALTVPLRCSHVFARQYYPQACPASWSPLVASHRTFRTELRAAYLLPRQHCPMPISQVYKTFNEKTRTLRSPAFLTTRGRVTCSQSAALNRLEMLEGRALVSFILVPRADPAHRGDRGPQGRGTLVFAWAGRAAGRDAAAPLLPTPPLHFWWLTERLAVVLHSGSKYGSSPTPLRVPFRGRCTRLARAPSRRRFGSKLIIRIPSLHMAPN